MVAENNKVSEKKAREMKIIGERIQEILSKQEMSQKELGQIVGLTTEHINRICKGHSYPNGNNLTKIADALGVPVEALRSETEVHNSIYAAGRKRFKAGQNIRSGIELMFWCEGKKKIPRLCGE